MFAITSATHQDQTDTISNVTILLYILTILYFVLNNNHKQLCKKYMCTFGYNMTAQLLRSFLISLYN